MSKLGKEAFSTPFDEIAVLKDKSMDDLGIADLRTPIVTDDLVVLYHIDKKWREVLHKVIPHEKANVAVVRKSILKFVSTSHLMEVIRKEKLSEVRDLLYCRILDEMKGAFVYQKDIIVKLFDNLDIDPKYIVEIVAVVKWPTGEVRTPNKTIVQGDNVLLRPATTRRQLEEPEVYQPWQKRLERICNKRNPMPNQTLKIYDNYLEFTGPSECQ